MTKNKNIIFIAIGLLFPLLYKLFNRLFYYLVLDCDLIFLLPKSVWEHLLKNPFSLDAIFCFLFILFSLPFFFKMRKYDRSILESQEATITKFNGKGFIIALIIAFGGAGITVLWQLIARFLLADVGSIAESVKSFDTTFQSGTATSTYIWSLLSIGILGPIAEELIFRGVLFSGLNKYFNGFLVALISGVYFGLWHGELIQIVYTAILGITLGLVYAATRNMWFPMVIHLINNLISTLPPGLEDNETVLFILLGLRIIAIIPMIIIIYKMAKKNPNMRLKTTL